MNFRIEKMTPTHVQEYGLNQVDLSQPFEYHIVIDHRYRELLPLMGYAVFDRATLELKQLWIHEPYRRYGIAQELFESFSAPVEELLVDASNVTAQNFYRQNGCTDSGERVGPDGKFKFVCGRKARSFGPGLRWQPERWR
jgi:ribosomal protein S18 acetylase RimI-like enzyme